MQPGQTSDLVKSQFGYHIIKVVEKKAAATRSLADVRQQLSDQLAFETAQVSSRRNGSTNAEESVSLTAVTSFS